MAVVRSDRIGVPTGLNKRRVLAWVWSRADDALAGRVVWSVAALPDGHAAGRRLREVLHDRIEVVPLGVEAAGLGKRVRPGDVVILHDCFTELITAFLPAARLLDIREVPLGGDAARAERVALAWTSLLGEIVEQDRADRVGGTIQVRPVVAAR
jgi:hypothetical protein